MGGFLERMSYDPGRPIDRGLGPVPNLLALLVVTALLLSNFAALVLSVPYILKDSPRDYTSSVEGTIELPYVPLKASELVVEAPLEVIEGEPFNITVRTQGGFRPYLPLHVNFFSNGPTASYLLHDMLDGEGAWYGWTRVPGLPYLGYLKFNVTISMGPGVWKDLGTAGSIQVISNPGYYVIPSTNENLSLGDAPTVALHGPIGPSSIPPNVEMAVEGGPLIELQPLRDRVYRPPLNLSLPSGWKRVRFLINREEGNEFILHFPDEESLGPDELKVSFKETFECSDELYGQEANSEWTGTDDDNWTLYSRTYYHVQVEVGSSSSNALSGPMDAFPGRRMVLRAWSATIPLFRQGTSGEFNGTFYLDGPPDGFNGPDIVLFEVLPEGEAEVLHLNITLKVNQAPRVLLEPDPFDIEGFGEDLPISLEISDGWELVSYRRFLSEPVASLDDRGLELSRTDDGLGRITYNATVPFTLIRSGEDLSVQASTSFRYNAYLSILAPLPPFVFSLPFHFGGWAIPAWFFLLAFAILLSAVFLYVPIINLSNKGPRPSGPIDVLSKGSGPSELSRTFFGAMFFSWAVVMLFQLLEQPTPVPDILSEEVPIWIRMLLLSEASVWEEISGRVLLIGVPLTVYLSAKRPGRSNLKVLLGGTGKFGCFEALLVLFSSSLFGLAHLGWGPWKVVPTFVTGLLFGYLYVRVGLHASIVMHFLFDYSGFLYEMTGMGAIVFLAEFALVAVLGGIFLADLFHRGLKWGLPGSFMKKVPSWYFLVMHSFLCIVFGAYALKVSTDNVFPYLLLSVPILELVAYLLHRAKLPYVPAIIVYFSSLASFALAPVGLGWILAKADVHNGR